MHQVQPLFQPRSLPWEVAGLKPQHIRKKPMQLCVTETWGLNILLRKIFPGTNRAFLFLIFSESSAPILFSVQFAQVPFNRPCPSNPFWKSHCWLLGSYGNMCYSQVYFNCKGEKLQGENITFSASHSYPVSKLKTGKWVPLSLLQSACKLVSCLACTVEFKLFYSKSYKTPEVLAFDWNRLIFTKMVPILRRFSLHSSLSVNGALIWQSCFC